MPIKKFYGVRVGRDIGIFNTWKECQKSVNGFSSAEFKSFLTLEETEKYIKDNN
jgi:ribonuclease H-related protein